jgi:hypothetical protein
MKVSLIWMAAAFIIATPITAIDARGLTREHHQRTLQLFGESIRGVSRKPDDSHVCGVKDSWMDSVILPKPVLHRIAGPLDDRRSICVERAFLLIEMSR